MNKRAIRKVAGLGVLGLMTLALFGAPDTSPFKTVKARDARVAYEAQLRRTEEEYAAKISAAQKAYRSALDEAKLAAMKAGNLDEANRIQAELALLDQQLKAAIEPRRHDRGLVIESARFGVDDKWADVTTFVRDRVADGVLRPLGGVPDPAFGRHKTIMILGTYGGREFVLSFTTDNPLSSIVFGQPPKDAPARR